MSTDFGKLGITKIGNFVIILKVFGVNKCSIKDLAVVLDDQCRIESIPRNEIITVYNGHKFEVGDRVKCNLTDAVGNVIRDEGGLQLDIMWDSQRANKVDCYVRRWWCEYEKNETENT